MRQDAPLMNQFFEVLGTPYRELIPLLSLATFVGAIGAVWLLPRPFHIALYLLLIAPLPLALGFYGTMEADHSKIVGSYRPSAHNQQVAWNRVWLRTFFGALCSLPGFLIAFLGVVVRLFTTGAQPQAKRSEPFARIELPGRSRNE